MSTEDANTLRSASFARLIDVVSEGPIFGLVNGDESIFFDETPLKASDGTYNFLGVTYVQRNGNMVDDYVPGFTDTESVVAVNVRCKENIPITRTITNPDADAVLINIAIPALSHTSNDTGDTAGSSVRMHIDIQPSDGDWYRVVSNYVKTPMTVISSTRVSTGSNTNSQAADLKVTLGGRGAVADFLIEYKVVTDTAWSTWRAGSITADGFTTHDTGGYNGEDASGPLSNMTFRSYLTPGYAYEWRLTYTSGSGGGLSMSLSGTFDIPGTADNVEIRGKTTSRYLKQLNAKLLGSAPWTIRVTRTSDDSSSAYDQNETWWDSYVEVIDSKFSFPYSALIASSVNAENFSSIPARAFDIRGLMVQIPSNYNPTARTYTGSWDGTFIINWTDNPAWCFYDLLTHPRYGLGEFIGTGVDKWALYSIAQYCDELVPDGFGGTEPRFTCNLYLGSRQEAYKVVQDFASIFRAMVYWSVGSITASQDSPADPVKLYTPANVIDGLFTYSGSSAKTRHTVALVTWNDPNDMCRPKVEYVEDREGMARYGYVSTEVLAVGCISRGQAHRVGKWLLYTERLESEIVAFSTGLEAAPGRPGSVISIADPSRAGERMGGRLLAATATAVTLDAPVTLEAGLTYTLACMRANNTVQETTVTTGAGTTSSLTLSPALAETPAKGSIWVLSSVNIKPQLFRVVSLAESARGEFEVVAMAHDPSKYDYIEQGLALEPRKISMLTERPLPPENLSINEALYASGNILATRLDVSWTPADTASAYVVTWRRSDGALAPEKTVFDAGIEIDGALDGQIFEIRVFSQNALGNRSSTYTTITHTVIGKMAKPSGVANFVVARAGDTLRFGWAPIPDLDAARYEIRRGESWETAIVVGSVVHPTNTLALIAPRGGTFLIKSVDTSGNYSDVPSQVVSPDVSGINVVVTHEDGFTGLPDSMSPHTVATSPSWGATTTWDDAMSWDAFSVRSGLILDAGLTTGTYISEPLDIGYVAQCLVSVDAKIEVIGPLSMPWDAYTQPWDFYAGDDWVWNAATSDVSASYEISTSADGVAWSDWARYVSGSYSFRFLRVRVTVATTKAKFRPFLWGLTINADVPDRVASFGDVAVSTAGATIPFLPEFVGVSTVQVTLQSASIGDTVSVTAKSTSSVTIHVFDSAGAAKAGVVDVDVFGYGERI